MAFERIHLVFLGLAICFLSGSVSGHEKKLKKITSCRCSMDEGEIDLRKLAGKEGKPRFFNIPSNYTNSSFSWNPCNSYSLNGSACKGVAACMEQKGVNTSEFYSVAKQDTAEFFHREDGEIFLTYKGTAFNKTSVFSVVLKCDPKEEGKVDPVIAYTTKNAYETVLYSKYACPSGSSSTGLGLTAIATMSVITILGVLIIAFLIFVVHLRNKLPDGVPKPSVCTSMKVALGMIFAKFCPCCNGSGYAKVP